MLNVSFLSITFSFIFIVNSLQIPGMADKTFVMQGSNIYRKKCVKHVTFFQNCVVQKGIQVLNIGFLNESIMYLRILFKN